MNAWRLRFKDHLTVLCFCLSLLAAIFSYVWTCRAFEQQGRSTGLVQYDEGFVNFWALGF